MVFNATFNNISAISWLSVLLVEETGVPGENHQPVASHRQTVSHNVVSSTPRLTQILGAAILITLFQHGSYTAFHNPTKICPGAPWSVRKRLGAPGDSPGAPGSRK